MGGSVSYVRGAPGASGFGSRSTAEEVTAGISLHSRTAIITGANGGLGFETTRVLASRGAHVIMACRNTKAAEDAKRLILKENPEAQLDIFHLDLGSLASVKKFANQFLSLRLPLNILINNAGIASGTFKLSEDNIELTFATNHIGHFLLTTLLLDNLVATAKDSGIEGRIVVVSSMLHILSSGELNIKHLNDSKSYLGIFAYGDSKLANIQFSKELARRLKDQGAYVTVNALHPGPIKTRIYGDCWDWFKSGTLALFSLCFKTISQGAATICYAAAHPDLDGVTGKYLCDCNEATASKHASDMKLAAATWKLSEKLIEKIVEDN
ncbi:hypothetical protein O6H91_Y059900 [Diphasiastrum complanatum]|nr:hypothetical protein O6H91_Y059900 [Diphasiastrum complanatum]